MKEAAGAPPLVFECAIATRWVDFDANRHLNNAIFLTYLEHARDRLFETVGIARDGNVLARTELDFRAPVELSSRELRCRITCLRLGRTSVVTSESLFGEAGVVLGARSVSVLVGANGRPMQMPRSVRTELTRYLASATNDIERPSPPSLISPWR